MRRALWPWACLCVLYVGCGDDDPARPRTGGAGDAGEGQDYGAGADAGGVENAGGSTAASAGAGNQAQGGTGDAAAGAAVGGEGAQLNLPPFASGTRLRAILNTSGDASALVGWHDTELDVDCTFRKAEDDVMRCLPSSFISAYSDDTCENALTIVQDGCVAPSFALANGPACSDGVSAYEVLGVVTPAKTYIMSGGLCQETTFGAVTFHATTPIPISMFLGAEDVLNRKGDELGLNYLRADDGTLHPVMASDLGREHACSPTGVGDYVDRCVPFGTAIVSANNRYFSDEDCMDLVAHRFCGEGSPSAVMRLDIETLECSSKLTYSYSEVGSEVTAASNNNGQACTAFIPAAQFYEIGASIAPESLPEISSVDLGEGRIKARYASTSEGEPLTFATFYDSLLDFTCSPLPTVASGLRCMPVTPYASLYADDACEDLLWYAAVPAGQCPEAAPPEYVLAGDFPLNVCESSQPVRVYKTGSKVTVDGVLYSKTQQGCSATGSDPNGLVFYATTEVPAQDLAEITRETE